ncbi:MAG: site-specific integrase [Acidimicrobiaceae bacterium]|nr:site-specific integrase [Acidimicrobiaceae bacterium]
MSSIRRKQSGRYEARYRDPSGRLRGKTFATKTEAKRFLLQVGNAIVERTFQDPALGKVRFAEYADWWLANRADLRPRTAELYEGLLRLHIKPVLGDTRFDQLMTPVIRAWHAQLLSADKPGAVTVAKAYRLLRTILNDAIDDGLIVRNPCSIRGAGVERSPERPIATIDQVAALAGAIEPRYRAMVLLATFCGLRLGELLALRRNRLDLLHASIRIDEQRQELSRGTRIIGPPKTAAGVRTIAIPPHMVIDLEKHLLTWTSAEPDALVFTGPRTESLRRATFNTAWDQARTAVGLPHLHFHDLRHTGNTLAAATGASTKELMSRMGHASPRAALIYQHATAERDIAIAKALSAAVTGRTEERTVALDLTTPGESESNSVYLRYPEPVGIAAVRGNYPGDQTDLHC